MIRYIRHEGGSVVYDKDLGAGIDGLLSDEALKSPPPPCSRAGVVEDCCRFLEEEANVADRRGDYVKAMTVRQCVSKLRERVK